MLLRCVLFCLLSVLTNYLYIAALEVLDCTVVTALFATNASFVYLLSWVVLRHQFLGRAANKPPAKFSQSRRRSLTWAFSWLKAPTNTFTFKTLC